MGTRKNLAKNAAELVNLVDRSLSLPRSFRPLRLNSSVLTLLLAVAFVHCIDVRGTRAQAPQQVQPQQRAKEAPRAKEGGRYWQTQWSFQDVNVGKLASRLASIGIELGLDLEGTASVDFQVGVPLTSLRDGKAYRLDGTLTSPALTVDGVELRDFAANIRYRDGKAKLEKLHSLIGRKADATKGSIDGSGSLQLIPRGDMKLDVSVKRISIAPIADLVTRFSGETNKPLIEGGIVSGKVSIEAPLDSISRLETYTLSGTVRGDEVKMAGLPPATFDLRRVEINDGNLSLDSFTLQAGIGSDDDKSGQKIRLFGDATIPLTGRGEFHFQVAGDDIPTEALTGSSESQLFTGKIDFRAVGNGRIGENMATSTWKLDTLVASPALRMAGVDVGLLEHRLILTPNRLTIMPLRDRNDLPDSVKIRSFQADYRIDKDSVELSQLDAQLFGGELSGAAKIPFDQDESLELGIRFTDIRPSIRFPVSANVAPSIAATLSGNLDWKVPVRSIDRPSTHDGHVNLAFADIRIGDERVGQLSLSLAATKGNVTLTGEGDLFDGTVRVEAGARLEGEDSWSVLAERTTRTVLEFNGVSIASLLSLASKQRSSLTGRLGGKLTIAPGDWRTTNPLDPRPQDLVELPSADIDVQLRQVRYDDALMSRSFSLAGEFDGSVFSINSMVGDYAGGTARIDGRVHLFNGEQRLRPRADLNVSTTRVDIERGLCFLGPLAKSFRGTASASTRVTGDREAIRVRGSVEGRDLVLYDLPIGSAHSGIAADADVNTRRWRLRFPTVRSSVGGGQLEGDLVIASARRGSGGIDLTSEWKTRRVDFFRLTTLLGQSTSLARGEITGQMSLRGKAIRTIDDVSGQFNFRLGQTGGAGIPGLIGVSRYLGPISLVTESFDTGEAKGSIGRGALVLDEFWLGSDDAIVKADGKVYLRSRRMDLNVLVATGNFQDVAAGFAQLAREYAFRSLLPPSAILSLTELLRDRTLVVKLLGTTNAPIVRVQPVETFREEAARFLLREGQRLVLTGITAGAVDGLSGF